MSNPQGDSTKFISALLTLLDKIELAQNMEEVALLVDKRFEYMNQVEGWTVVYGESVSSMTH